MELVGAFTVRVRRITLLAPLAIASTFLLRRFLQEKHYQQPMGQLIGGQLHPDARHKLHIRMWLAVNELTHRVPMYFFSTERADCLWIDLYVDLACYAADPGEKWTRNMR